MNIVEIEYIDRYKIGLLNPDLSLRYLSDCKDEDKYFITFSQNSGFRFNANSNTVLTHWYANELYGSPKKVYLYMREQFYTKLKKFNIKIYSVKGYQYNLYFVFNKPEDKIQFLLEM